MGWPKGKPRKPAPEAAVVVKVMLDKSRSYGQSIGASGIYGYTQDGKNFDLQGNEWRPIKT